MVWLLIPVLVATITDGDDDGVTVWQSCCLVNCPAIRHII